MNRIVRIARRVSLSICLTVWCVCGAAVTPVGAQTAAGEITGVVKDQAGAAVPGATITVTETRTNRQRVAVSTGDGVVHRRQPGTGRVPPRSRAVRVQAGAPRGHSSGDRREGAHRFRSRGRRRCSEQVTVVGDAPMVRAATASLGTVVENEQVVQLPLNGRLFIMLAAIAPGVALPPNSVLPRINGGRPRTNEYLFDGISVLQPEPGPGRLLPDHRRHPGVQDREQQPAGRVRPLQRRRGQPHDQVGDQRLPRQRVRVLPQRGTSMPGTTSSAAIPRNRSTAGISTAACSAARWRRTGRSSSSTIRDSARASAAR